MIDIVKWAYLQRIMIYMYGKQLILIIFIILKFHKCSRILTNRDSYPSSTVSAANLYKFGKNQVTFHFIQFKTDI